MSFDRGEQDLWVSREEHQRVVNELQRANRRLSGTLQIVLGTLDSADVSTLFSRVLELITETIDAGGTLVYLAMQDGFHLRGASAAIDQARIARYIPFGRSIEGLTVRAGGTLRLQVRGPQRDELRQGRLSCREVVDEATDEVHRLDPEVLPPFASFYAVPVTFGGHVVALIEVGWPRLHPLAADDAELLDAVARYLSVQLVGAFSVMRTQREAQLKDIASRIRERMLEQRDLDEALLVEAFGMAATELSCVAAPVIGAGADRPVEVMLPLTGTIELPANLVPQLPAAEEVVVRTIDASSALGEWLSGLGEPAGGAFMDAGLCAGMRCACLFLRDAHGEPFDDLELAFMDDLACDLVSLGRGEDARSQDKAISQALQTGMRNELQEVSGISAQAVYSSATAAAFVGGDFYDLIRLPDRRACVIMGDVSGKGVEAASVSAAVKTALGAYAWEGLRPAHMVRLLNDFLLGFSRVETFATLFVGIVDLGRRTLTYCSAGHPPALLLRQETGELESLGVQSGVVGAFSDMRYHDGRVRLDKGDLLLLYTDGTTEARSPSGGFFGEDGLRDALVGEVAHGFEGMVDRLLDLLDDFTGRRLADDVAMVALRFDEVGWRG